MRALIYSTETTIATAELRRLIEYARSRVDASLVQGIWIDEGDEGSILRRGGGADLLRRVKPGDCLVVPDVGTLAGPLREFREVIDHLVYRRGLTLHVVAVGFVYGPSGDKERMDELAEQSYREWRLRRTREGVAQWKAEEGHVTGWAPYGERIVIRNGKRTTEGCWWERRWIAKIVEWRKAGLSYPAIVDSLRQRKAKTSRRTEWTRERVRRVVAAQERETVRAEAPILPSVSVDGDAWQRLCPPVAHVTRRRKRTSEQVQTFEVDGIPGKKYPKPATTATEMRQEYRDVMRIMRMFCRLAERQRRDVR